MKLSPDAQFLRGGKTLYESSEDKDTLSVDPSFYPGKFSRKNLWTRSHSNRYFVRLNKKMQKAVNVEPLEHVSLT